MPYVSPGVEGSGVYEDATKSVTVDMRTEVTSVATAIDNLTTAVNSLTTAVNAVNTNLGLIKDEVITMDTSLSSIATSESEIADDIETIKTLGQTGSGYKVNTNGNGVSDALFWKTFIVEGLMNEETPVSSAQQAAAIAKIDEYIAEFNSEFNTSG